MEVIFFYSLHILQVLAALAAVAAILWGVMAARKQKALGLAFFMGPLIALGSAVGVMVAAFVLGSAFVKVAAGERAVIFSTVNGVSDRILGEGIHAIKPIVESVQNFDVRTQVLETETSTATKDQQPVNTHVKFWYHPEPTEVNKLYQELGPDWSNKGFLTGNLAEILKQEIVKYDALSLLSTREVIAQGTLAQLRVRLRKYHVIVDDLTIGDIGFTDSFNKAIEEKQVAEQNALKKRYDLQAAKTQADIARTEAEGRAQAAIAEAKGQAQSAQIVAASISSNPNYMKLKELENRKDVATVLATSKNVIYLPSNSVMMQPGAPGQ